MAATAIVVLFPDLEPLVGPWRRAHTADGADGMPPHVTLIYPFVDESRIDDELEAVRDVLRAYPPFDVRFADTGRFEAPPPALYLRPEPPEPFLAIIAALEARFPDFPPYAGAHDTVVPHLTVAQSSDDLALARADREVGDGLPAVARVREVHVMAHRLGAGWVVRQRLGL